MTGEIFRTASGALIETASGGVPSRAAGASTPTLTGVSPTSGTDAGGTLLTLTGSGFTGATTVTIGGVAVGSFTPINDTSVTFTAPSHADGATPITVTNLVGTSGSVNYTYAPVPSLASVSPTSGTTDGGATLTLTGANLSGVTSLTIGGLAAGFGIVNNTTITLVDPAHAAGAVSIAVTAPGGSSGAVTFTYTTPVTTGAPPRWASIIPWVVQPTAGTTITVTGTNLTGASVIDTGSGLAVPTTVASSTQLTFIKPGSGPSYYPYAFLLRNANGDSDRFGLITGLASATSTIDNLLGLVVAGAPLTIYGYSYPFGVATAFQVQRNSDSVQVDSKSFVSSATDGSWSATITAPTPGQYFLHSNTSSSGADFWTGVFTTVVTLTAPFIIAVAPAAKVPGMDALVTISGTNFTGATAVTFGSVVASSFTVVNASTITLPRAPDQSFGLVAMTVTGATGELSNAVGFQYLHAIVEPVPVSVGGAAPVVSSRWKGPWAAINAPKSGQVTSITVDPAHGNGTGTGSDGITSNLWSTFDFLNTAALGYPKLADGGTVHIRAGSFTAGPFARGHLADFPGGINIVGVGADQCTFLNYGTGPSGDKAMSIWNCNTYIYGLGFQMTGIDEATSGYSAIRFYNETGTAGSATAHYMHIEKCRYNQCEEAVTSDTGWTTTGENWCLYLKDVDFSPTIPDCYNTDLFSHEVYSGSQQFWETCNSYGPLYGTTHKGRSPSMTIVGCWTRRTLNRWIDYPEAGVFQAWNSTFTEAVPQVGDGGDTDMHVFEYCSTTPNLTVNPTSPLFNNCDLWFSRGVDISNGGTQGEDWMTPIAINFVNCRAHWSNQNGAAPKIWSVDPADFSTHNERIVGIPLSNPGSTFENVPAAPAHRTP